MRRDHPERKAIPVPLKKGIVERQNGICGCGCGQPVQWEKHRATTRFDHQPALEFRRVDDDGLDYDPPQLDPKYIIARCVASDRVKTAGKLHTSVGSDAHMAGKIRTLRGENKPKPKRKWASAPLKSRSSFGPKGSRPFNRKPKPHA